LPAREQIWWENVSELQLDLGKYICKPCPTVTGGWEVSDDIIRFMFQVISFLHTLTGQPQQVWDVDRLIRARNPGAVFTTTERVDVTWQTLRSITYSPTLQQGAVGSASVQEASLVRRLAMI